MTATCDTSVLVPALVSWHVAHDEARAALAEVQALPAHVVLETYSVLTRLPGAQRLDAGTAAAALRALPWPVVALGAAEHVPLVEQLATAQVVGGATYDALVAATARAHDFTLLTRDRRARRTYELLGIRYRFTGA